MDLNDLKRKVQAARRFTVEVEGRRLVLQRPSDFDLQMAGAKAGLQGGATAAERLLWERLLVAGSVVDWQGVTAADFGVEGDSTPVPFDADAVSMLLDAQPQWSETVAAALFAAIAKASHDRSDAEKN